MSKAGVHVSDEKLARFKSALAQLIERLEEDRNVLAAVLVGSLSKETIWCRERIHLWVIQTDGVTRRMKSDGDKPRVWRTLVENDVNISAELIERSKFKQMVEGASRTSFTHSFFAARELVWARDESIIRWFESANSLATKDQRQARFTVATWIIHGLRQARRFLDIKADVDMARGEVIGLAWAFAALEVVDAGIVYEDNILYWAESRQPDRFKTLYRDVIAGSDREPVEAALDLIAAELDSHGEDWLGPLVSHLKKNRRVVELSEISDKWAHSQLYPFHLESGCEWLARTNRVAKHATAFRLTKKSRTEVEEPAYEWVS